MKTFPDQYELISFFEAEPSLLDKELVWYYNTITFNTVRGEDEIKCEILPSYSELKLSWHKRGQSIAEISFADIEHIEVITNGSQEYLVVKFQYPELQEFNLQLKPHVRITWQVSQRI